MKVCRTLEFDRDLKKLTKKFLSLPDDLEIFIKVQLLLYHHHQLDNHGIFPIPGYPQLFKAKKIACKSLKGRGAQSGLRIIYRYIPSTVTFIEVYFKADSENPNFERLKEYKG